MSKREVTEKLFEKIMDLRAQGLTQKEIGEELGYDKAYISRLLTSRGIKTDMHKPKAKRFEPISDLHLKLGRMIHIYRMYSKCLDIPKMADEMKITPRKLKLLEEGKLDITVSALQKLFKKNFRNVMAQLLSEEEPSQDVFD